MWTCCGCDRVATPFHSELENFILPIRLETRSGAAKAVASNPLFGRPCRRAGQIDPAREYFCAQSGGERIPPRGQPREPGAGSPKDGWFRRALEIDPGHEAARQTMVALLLEAKRVGRGAVSPAGRPRGRHREHGFRHAARRIMVESNDISTAFVLQRHAAPPDRNRTFTHCRCALPAARAPQGSDRAVSGGAAPSPSAAFGGSAWGSRFRRFERRKMHWKAFTRAKSAGNLAPNLLEFVEQRSGNSSSCVRNAGPLSRGLR